MLVTVKKQVEQSATVEIELPAYFKDKTFDGHYAMICEDESLIKVSERLAVRWPKEGSFYESEVSTILSKFEPATEKEFLDAYSELIESFDSSIIPADKIIIGYPHGYAD